MYNWKHIRLLPFICLYFYLFMLLCNWRLEILGGVIAKVPGKKTLTTEEEAKSLTLGQYLPICQKSVLFWGFCLFPFFVKLFKMCYFGKYPSNSKCYKLSMLSTLCLKTAWPENLIHYSSRNPTVTFFPNAQAPSLKPWETRADISYTSKPDKQCQK